MPFELDPEVASAMAVLLGGKPRPEPSPVGDVQARREFAEPLWQLFNQLMPSVTDVTQTDFYTTTTNGHSLLLRWYSKAGTSPKSPAVLYIHGGGMISLAVDHYDKIIANLVSQSSVPFLSVDYRLAPEHPNPIPVQDCYAGLSWLHSNAEKLDVDPRRIAVMGDSGGGGLAASLASYTLLKGGPMIAKQILIYPMLDDRNLTADANLVPFATWNYNDNATGWQALLGDRCGKEGVLPHEAAGRLVDATGLPELYLDIGELDIFREECIDYVRKHGKAGIPAEFHIYPAVPHGWEPIAPEAKVTKRAMENRLRAIMSIKSVGS